MDDLTLFNTDHRIIPSCTKSVRVLYKRQKRKRLKPEDVTLLEHRGRGQGVAVTSSNKTNYFVFSLHIFSKITLVFNSII